MKKLLSYTLLLTVLALGSCKKLVDEDPLSSGKLEDF